MYHLASEVADIQFYLEKGSVDGYVGMDTEGTGLDTRRADLVGLSLSVSEGEGLYVPLAHTIGSNLSKPAVVRVLQEFLKDGCLAPVFYNAKYDLNLLQKNLGWYPENYCDALEVVYMEDPDRKEKGLKVVAKEDLNFDMEKFEDLFTPEEINAGMLNIATKHPQRCTRYAGSDADAALRVWRQKKKTREDQAFAVKIDTALIDTVRKMEFNGGMVLNVAYIDEQIDALTARAGAMREQILRMAGKVFEPDSPKQLGDVLFDHMGIPSPGKTKTGNHRTDAETLEKLANQYPICTLTVAYKKVVKARGSYFEKLKKLDRTGLPVRFQFHMFSAPTFRFASPGGSPEKDGGCGLNIQAVSNGESMDMMAVDLSREGSSTEYVSDLDDEDILVVSATAGSISPTEPMVDPKSLPWTVLDESSPPKLMCFRETCVGCLARCAERGIDTTRRKQKNLKLIPSVRESFQAPEGWTLASFDYDRQELVIGANMSKEPKWLRALKAGEDLHLITASDAFGIPMSEFVTMEADPSRKEERKRKRDVGKTLNFATFYGATAYTLARKADITQSQADNIFEGFTRGLSVLFQWIGRVHAFARKEGYTTTYFGRRRHLRQFYYDASGMPLDRKMQAFGDRSAVNTAIQGTAAEVTRIAMVKVAHALKVAGYTKNEVRMLIMLHDDLTFMIRNERVKEIVPIIKKNMEFHVKSWEVQLTAGLKIGRIWGRQLEVKRYAEWLESVT